MTTTLPAPASARAPAPASARAPARAPVRATRTASRRRVKLRHSPGLDGLRGLAVIAVLLYHAGLRWAGGGFLGVELFFVLSGFLITSLLLAEWWRTATITLTAFWGRRARRLLPALLGVILVIGIYYAVAGPSAAVPGLRGDGLATLLYFGNWHQIVAGAGYFAVTGPQSPLKHTWSLAIEEQFYLVWPLLVLGLLWLASRRTRTVAGRVRSLRALLALTTIGVLCSAIETAVLSDGGNGLNRVYYGTDTRASSLLIGAALAILFALRRWRAEARLSRVRSPLASVRGTRLVEAGSGIALLGLLAAMLFANESSGWLYPWGLVILDVAALVVIATVVSRPHTAVTQILTWPPLQAVGQISYGLYLWHYPLFLWLDQATTGLSGAPLLCVRLIAAVGASVVSYAIIEQPVRRRRLPVWMLRSITPVAIGCALGSLLLGSALSSISFSDANAKSLPRPKRNLQGSAGPCQLKLTDSSSVGVSPLPVSTAAKTEYSALGGHELTWSGASTVTYHTCPPAKVLLVGDSLAYTLGVGLMENEQRWGIELANAALLGCAFTPGGELLLSGNTEAQPAGCPTALQTWAKDAGELGASAVVIELGYRDQFDWKLGGKLQRLGQAAFDATVRDQISQYVKVLGAGGKRQVLFLSVPYTKPPANPDGSASAATDPSRHAAINRILTEAVRGDANAHVLNLDTVLSPSGHYQGSVNGNVCRFDGIHFTLYCSELLQPYVLTEVRRLIGR